MQKHIRRILADTIAAVGPRIAVHIESGGRHPHLVLEGGGVRRVTPVAGSPRDADASVNMARQDVRRMLKEMKRHFGEYARAS